MKLSGKILSVLCALLIFLTFALGLVTLTAHYTLRDPAALCARICDDEYYECVQASVKDEVTRAAMLLTVDYSVFEGSVTRGELNSASEAYLTAVLERIINGGDAPLPAFSSDALDSAVAGALEAYAAENGLELAQDSADEVSAYISQAVDAGLRAVGEKYLSKLPDISGRLSLLVWGWAPAAAAVVLCALMLVLRRRRLARAALDVLTALYASAFLVHVLSSLLVIKDYISNVALSSSLLRELLLRLYRIGAGDLARMSGIPLLPVTLLLVADIVFISVSGGTKKSAALPDAKPAQKIPGSVK